jgi:hypothetical protein
MRLASLGVMRKLRKRPSSVKSAGLFPFFYGSSLTMMMPLTRASLASCAFFQ